MKKQSLLALFILAIFINGSVNAISLGRCCRSVTNNKLLMASVAIACFIGSIRSIQKKSHYNKKSSEAFWEELDQNPDVRRKLFALEAQIAKANNIPLKKFKCTIVVDGKKQEIEIAEDREIKCLDYMTFARNEFKNRQNLKKFEDMDGKSVAYAALTLTLLVSGAFATYHALN